MDHVRPSTSSDNQAPTTENDTGPIVDERLVKIFETEIDREIAEKMVAVSTISDNIRKCQHHLEQLRKEAVIKFYMDSFQDAESVEQPSVHPAVKKLIGKRPGAPAEQYMKSDAWIQNRETRKKLLKKYSTYPKHKKRKTSYQSALKVTSNNESIITPCYVPPNIPGNPQENSSLRGNTKRMHMRVLVGNVAKQVDNGIDDVATHKWMVYIRSAPGSLDIEKQVSKVRFFLHPSYTPHDVVTVPNPPFTLNRRGWGEFQMKVQLYFKNHLNKTVDIIHNLKLNGTRSGHHTRSAETFADLWIYPHRVGCVSEDTGSSQILLLASDMLKEDVPSFATEVTCHKCQTTSLGTDVYSCTCDTLSGIEDANYQDDKTALIAEESSSEDTDSDLSDESVSDAQFLGRLYTCPKNRDSYGKNICSSLIKAESITLEDSSEQRSTLLGSTQKCNLTSSQESLSSSIKKESNGLISSCSHSTNDLVTFKSEEETDSNRDLNDKCSKNVGYIHDIHKDSPSHKSSFNSIHETTNFDSMMRSDLFIEPKLEILDLKMESEDIVHALEIKQEETTQEDLNSKSLKGQGDTHVNITEYSNQSEEIALDNTVMPIEVKPEFVETEVVYGLESIGNTSTIDDVVKDISNSQSTDPLLPVKSEDLRQKSFVQQDSNQIIEDTPIYDFSDHVVEEVVIDNHEYFSNTFDNQSVSSTVDQSSYSKECKSQQKPTIQADPTTFKDSTVILLENPSLLLQDLTTVKSDNMSYLSGNNKSELVQTSEKCIVVTGGSLLKPSVGTKCKKSDLPKRPSGIKVCANQNNVGIRESKKNHQSILKPCLQKRHTLTTDLQKSSSLLKPHLQKLTFVKSTKPVLQNSQSLLKPSLKSLISSQSSNTQSILNSSINKNNKVIANLKNSTITSSSATDSQKQLPNNCKKVVTNRNAHNTQVHKISLTNSVWLGPNVHKVHIQMPNSKNGFLNCSSQPKTNIEKYVVLKKGDVESANFLSTANQSSALKPNAYNSQIQPVTNTLPSYGTQDSLVQLPTNKSSNPVGQKFCHSSTTKSSKNSLLKCSSRSLTTEIPISPKNYSNKLGIVNSNTHLKNIPEHCATESKTQNTFIQSLSSLKMPVVSRTNYRNVQSPTKCSVGNPKELMSFDELTKIICFPKASVPFRPVSNLSSGSDYEIKMLEIEEVLSCNSLHSDLPSTAPRRSEAQFGRKMLVVNKEHMNSILNDQVLYYLEQLRLLVNSCHFEEVEYAVRWLVRGLPLVHPAAKEASYRMVHPYCASTHDIYSTWPHPKQCASEWLRAKTVWRLLVALQTKGIPLKNVWPTTRIYSWCQKNGYSPAYRLRGADSTESRNEEFIQLLNKKTTPDKVVDWMVSALNTIKEEEIDIAGVTPELRKESIERETEEADLDKPLLCGRQWVRDLHTYTRCQSGLANATLGLEPLVPGGSSEGVAATLLSHLTATFAEDLLRHSLATAVNRGASCVEPGDVCRAIMERPEFDLFTQQGLQVNLTVTEHLKNQGLS